MFLTLIISLLALGVGYALINSDLTINGSGKVTASNWNVYFDNLEFNPNNVTLSQDDIPATINQTTNTDITFTVTFQQPGDFYEFTVDAVNDGSIDAMIGLITNNLNNNPIGTGNQLPAFVRYTATYEDGMPIEPNHLLSANGGTETFKVRVEYRTDINPSDLPGTQQTLSFSFGLQYIQASSNAVQVPHPDDFSTDSWDTVMAAIKSGNTSSYSLGETKTVELENNLGTHILRVANKSTPAECATPGFSQTACGFVLEFVDIVSTYNMNPTGEYQGIQYESGWNVDGWPASSMWTYLNDLNDSTSIINSLPAVIKNSIIDTEVISGHGSTAGETNFTSTDKLYLLSPHEVWVDDDENTSTGIDYYDTAYNNTRQLDYYANQNVTTSNYSGALKNDHVWWLRSARSNNDISFMAVSNTGSWSFGGANIVTGVSPAFRVA